VKNLAQRKDCSPAQLALAWVLAQGEDIVPIPGTKRLRYLEDNLGALDVALTPDEDSLFPPGIAQGERYAEAGMALLNP
jgi:aryl-alcohol dehydrogenase-like predicted oxidoreductase